MKGFWIVVTSQHQPAAQSRTPSVFLPAISPMLAKQFSLGYIKRSAQIVDNLKPLFWS